MVTTSCRSALILHVVLVLVYVEVLHAENFNDGKNTFFLFYSIFLSCLTDRPRQSHQDLHCSPL